MTFRRVLIAFVGLIALTAVGLFVFRSTLPSDSIDTVSAGSLTVAEDVSGSWQLGASTVELTDEGLTVTEPGGVVAWASDPGTAFVTGARGSVGWEEHRGYFWASVDLTDRLADQSVDSVSASGDEIVIGGTLSGGDENAEYTFTLTPGEESGVVVDVAADVDALGLVTGRSDGAGVHGFGEQFTDFDLDGRLLPIVSREQGVGRGVQPLTFLADMTNRMAGGSDDLTYAAWSAFVTGDVRAVRLDPALPESHAFAVADMRDSTRVGLHVWAPTVRAELVGAPDPLSLVASGRVDDAPVLADWTQDGAIVGLQGGTDKVRREVAELLDAGADLSAVWLQDWSGQRTTSFGERLWWTWQPDAQRYPDWQQLVDELADQGIRTTTYVNPFLTDAEPKGDTSIRNLFAEARDSGHLVENADGQPYLLDQGGFDAALVDLTDPAALDWFADVIASEVLTEGVEGFMADFGEGLPFDAVLADGDPRLLHNAWPLLWSQTVEQACELAGKPECVTWFRSGSAGMSEHAALFWNGDQLVDFSREDGLASALLGTFSAGVSGWPLVHADVGGYTSINAMVRDYVRPDDLLERWAEYAAFGVVMRTHEGNRPAANAQVYDSPEAERAFARMTRLFAALAPYRAQVIEEARVFGIPAIRHGWLMHPGSAVADVDTQFFLGDSILVAPVLEHDAEAVEVTFPPGTWTHLITGQEFDGDHTSRVEAPLGTPAAFIDSTHPLTEELLAAVASALGSSSERTP